MEKRPVFITMQSVSSMTIFDWERHIEEVQAALVGIVADENWDDMHVYGPNTGGFSPPAFCVQAAMTAADIGEFLTRLSKADPWLSVPVKVYATVGMQLTEVGTVAALLQAE